MRGDTDGCCDEDEVFDDVLPFNRWDQGTRECHVGQEKQWQERHDHVQEKQWQYDSLCAFDEEEDTDQTLKECKSHIKYRERKDACNRLVKECMHQTSSRR